MIIKEAVPEPMFARHETFHLRHMWLKKAYNGPTERRIAVPA